MTAMTADDSNFSNCTFYRENDGNDANDGTLFLLEEEEESIQKSNLPSCRQSRQPHVDDGRNRIYESVKLNHYGPVRVKHNPVIPGTILIENKLCRLCKQSVTAQDAQPFFEEVNKHG